MSDEPSAFPKPRTTRPGISAVHVTLAREMVNVHLQGRRQARTSPQQPAAAATPRPDVPTKLPFLAPRTRTGSSQHAIGPGDPLGGRRGAEVAARAPKSRVSVPARNHEGECKNPQCEQCGAVIIPLPKATFPFVEKPSITVNDWSIYTMKGPILLLGELDYLADHRFDFPLPEMIFGNNYVRVANDATHFVLDFNTLDALDLLAPTADFKVAYYEEWLSTRPKAKATENNEPASAAASVSSSPSLELVKPYDWTYSTNYKGTTSAQFVPTHEKLPLEKLLRPDPILFFDEAVLFEDELGDNGISMLTTKIRVMPLCLLLLCRLFLRVDDVAFRIRDTRLYVDFDTNDVLREYKVQDALYAELLAKVGRSADPKRLLRDSNWVSQNIPVVLCEVEKLQTPATTEPATQTAEPETETAAPEPTRATEPSAA